MASKKRDEQLDLIFEALKHQTRREILFALNRAGGSMMAGEIASRYSYSWPTISRHLRVLKDANLVTVTREAQSLKYELNVSAMNELWKNWFSHFEPIGKKS